MPAWDNLKQRYRVCQACLTPGIGMIDPSALTQRHAGECRYPRLALVHKQRRGYRAGACLRAGNRPDPGGRYDGPMGQLFRYRALYRVSESLALSRHASYGEVVRQLPSVKLCET
jgi:hypothetical protein